MKQSMTKDVLLQTAKQIQSEKVDIISPIRDFDIAFNPTEGVTVTVNGLTQEPKQLVANRNAEKNIATMLGMNGYFHRLREEQPELLDFNITCRKKFLQENCDRAKMFRSANGILRSVHSSSYLPIDSSDIIETVVQTSEKHGLVIRSAHIDHDNMFIKMTSEKLQTIDFGDDLRFGLLVSNNDNGQKGLRVMPFVERLICTNGMVVAKLLCEFKRTHRGMDKTKEFPFVYNLSNTPWSEIQKKKEIMGMVANTIDRAMESDAVQLIMDKIKQAKEKNIFDVEKTLEHIDKTTKLSKGEITSITERFNGGTDHTLWGFVNAITRTAQDAGEYSRATELETLGGDILSGNLRLVA